MKRGTEEGNEKLNGIHWNNDWWLSFILSFTTCYFLSFVIIHPFFDPDSFFSLLQWNSVLGSDPYTIFQLNGDRVCQRRVTATRFQAFDKTPRKFQIPLKCSGWTEYPESVALQTRSNFVPDFNPFTDTFDCEKWMKDIHLDRERIRRIFEGIFQDDGHWLTWPSSLIDRTIGRKK